VSGSGISWAICKSAPRSRQITTPAPHHSVFLQAGCPERMISFTTLKLEKVCSQLPKYSDSVVLPAFARCCCSSQYCMWSYAGTDGWTPYRFINLALHAMRALWIIAIKQQLHWPDYFLYCIVTGFSNVTLTLFLLHSGLKTCPFHKSFAS